MAVKRAVLGGPTPTTGSTKGRFASLAAAASPRRKANYLPSAGLIAFLWML